MTGTMKDGKEQESGMRERNEAARRYEQFPTEDNWRLYQEAERRISRSPLYSPDDGRDGERMAR
jgi:hypothetical protein